MSLNNTRMGSGSRQSIISRLFSLGRAEGSPISMHPCPRHSIIRFRAPARSTSVPNAQQQRAGNPCICQCLTSTLLAVRSVLWCKALAILNLSVLALV